MCTHKYEFKELFAEDAPEEVDLSVVAKKSLNRIVINYLLPFARYALVVCNWVLIVPILLSFISRCWMHRITLSWEAPRTGVLEIVNWLGAEVGNGLILLSITIVVSLFSVFMIDFVKTQTALELSRDGPDGEEVEGGEEVVVEEEEERDVVEAQVGNGTGYMVVEEEEEVKFQSEEESEIEKSERVEREEERMYGEHPDDVKFDIGKFLDDKWKFTPPIVEKDYHEEEEKEEIVIGVEDEKNEEDKKDEEEDIPENVPENVEEEEGVEMEELEQERRGRAEFRRATYQALGLGGFNILTKNTLWILAFSSLFMGVLGVLPLIIGRPLFPFAISSLPNMNKVKETAFHLSDWLFTSWGLLIGILVMYVMSKIPFYGESREKRIRSTFPFYLSSKILFLVLIHFLVAPFFIGWLAFYCISPLLPVYEIESDCPFPPNPSHPLFFLSLFWSFPQFTHIFLSSLWCAGLSLITYLTMIILNLREVLHPSFLAYFIRPREPRVELFQFIKRESLVIQLRRIGKSTLCVGSLVFVLLYPPSLFLQSCGFSHALHFSPLLPGFRLALGGLLILGVLMSIGVHPRALVGRVVSALFSNVAKVSNTQRTFLPYIRATIPKDQEISTSFLPIIQPIKETDKEGPRKGDMWEVESRNHNPATEQLILLSNRPPKGYDVVKGASTDIVRY